MKCMIRYYILLPVCLSPLLLDAFTGKRTNFVPRSHSVNAARELVGWYNTINLDCDRNYWSLSLNPTYNRSFNNSNITSFLFGREQFDVIGARVANRSNKAILADYFGLPSDYQGSICFGPTMSTFIFDFDFYLEMHSLLKGLYARVHAPVVHTTWDLNVHENVAVEGTQFFPAGYMGPARIERAQLPKSLKEVMDNRVNKVTFGDMRDAFEYGKILDRKVRSRISDVQFVLGYNFCTAPSHHLGLNLRASAPSGSRPDPEVLFDPIIGNAHHGEFGMGLSWHIKPWINEDETSYFGIYSDCNVTHLYKDDQLKPYDFHVGAGSRYTLVEKMCAVDNANVRVNMEPIPVQYQGRLFPAINVTTLCSTVSFPVQVDLALMFAYHRPCYLDINWGYGLWYRSAEKLHCRQAFPNDTYALKGDAQVYGFNASNTAHRLGATQSEAKIFGGQGDGNFAVTANSYNNANADNPVVATDSSDVNLFQINAADNTALTAINQTTVRTSNPAKLLTNCDINNDSALMPKALTHKLFVHVGRVWSNYDRSPFLGIGAEIEWRCRCVSNNSAQSHWGIWIKGGFTN